MTITPAHDPVDYEIAQRHGLEIVPIIGTDGKLLEIAGEFAGMKAAIARPLVAKKLEALGLIEKIDHNYVHSVALCYKSMQPIEPLLMPQWYVKVESLAARAIEAIETGKIVYEPSSFKKVQLDWLRNLKDWNISRQIWWGIPIAGAMPDNPDVAQDPDTFDTWFSSAQWPYTVLEALGESHIRDFYPTSVMQTGRDLIFLWVTRMIMLGLYIQDEVPFKKVYFHGMVLDKQGKKMSKSKGNVVSPVDLVAKYGADAVRFGLIIGSAAGSDIPMPEEKMVGGRNFANKLWNMARFVMMQLGDRVPSQLPTEFPPEALTPADAAILDSLSNLKKDVSEHIEKYRFAQALQAIHEFAWHQYADQYIEAAKHQKDGDEVTDQTAAILFHVLQTILILLHPFMPFVTEAIWARLPERTGMLIVATWPDQK